MSAWNAYKKDPSRKTYTVRGKDTTGVYRQLPASTDRAVSDELARTIGELVEHARYRSPLSPTLQTKLLDLPEETRARLADWNIVPGTMRSAGRSIPQQIDDHLATVATGGQSAEYLAETRSLLVRLLESAGVVALADLTAERIAVAIGDLRKRKRSQRTINKTIIAANAFAGWLVEQGRLPRNPLASIKTGTLPEGDRRPLSRDEYPHLYRAALKGPDFESMTGPDRAILYAVAVQTGLRASELCSLTVAHFELAAVRPYVQSPGNETKNGLVARQELRPETVAVLRERFAHLHPAALVFPTAPNGHMAAMIRADLARAREAWIDDATTEAETAARRASDFLADVNHRKLKLNFHCLRHACAVWHIHAGIPMYLVQKILRHGSYQLTADRYGRFASEREGAAPIPFPHMHPDRDQEQTAALAATGTDPFGQNPNPRGART